MWLQIYLNVFSILLVHVNHFIVSYCSNKLLKIKEHIKEMKPVHKTVILKCPYEMLFLVCVKALEVCGGQTISLFCN
jgi:hypothetical protein